MIWLRRCTPSLFEFVIQIDAGSAWLVDCDSIVIRQIGGILWALHTTFNMNTIILFDMVQPPQWREYEMRDHLKRNC